MKNIKILLVVLITTLSLQIAGQEDEKSELFIKLQKADSLLFEQGFNKCNFSALEKLMDTDFEFYHDQNGAQDKEAFLKGFKESICSNPNYKPIRKLVKGSLIVYPLKNEGKIYGAIQMGIHDFYIAEPNKELRFTENAKFIATWLLVNGEWKLKRELSYDHNQPKRVDTKKSATSPQTGYAPVNGLNMYYEIHGEGRPLVLIHGGGSTIQTTFGTILPLLAEQYKVIAVELQAHGHTNDRNTPESFEQDADDIAALLGYLKINKADFFGFSNGGNTAMQLGIRHPTMVNKLIITSAFYKRAGMIKGFFEGMEKAHLGNMPGYLKEAFLKINNDTNALRRMFEKDKARMIQFKDWSDEDLLLIKAPALIILGDEDVVTPEHAVAMKNKIRNSELMILPGNHGSFMGEGMSSKQDSKIPALMVGVIKEFLNK